MSQNAMFELILAVISLVCIIGWFITLRRERIWKRAAESYLDLLEKQRQLVDGVLDLNASLMADQVDLQRYREAEFGTQTHTGWIN
jgi:hypothetical protein